MEEHPLGHSTSTFVPKRLIDVRGDLRLIDSAEAELGRLLPYAALSYCWGPESDAQFQFTTTEETLEDRKRGFGFDELPQALKDAVTMTRALGIQYLWIDAICIVQRDQSDWQEQCGQMGDVYGMATVTLIAASSATCREGFLSPRRRQSFEYPCHPEFCEGANGSFMIYFYGHDEHPSDPVSFSYMSDRPEAERQRSISFLRDLRCCTWARRGWTFQESLVSARKIVFGIEDVHFVSHGAARSRRGGTDIDVWTQFERLQTPDHCHTAWMEIMKQYSRFTSASFTRESDSLPALSGLSSKFGALLPHEEYLAGHWSGNLIRSLMWKLYHPVRQNRDLPVVRNTQGNQPEPAEAVPSWSCMSRGAVSFVHEGQECHDTNSEVTVVRWALALATDDDYGALNSCEVCLEGYILDLSKLSWSNCLHSPDVIGSTPEGLQMINIDDQSVLARDALIIASMRSSSEVKWQWHLELGLDQTLQGTPESWTEYDGGLLSYVDFLISGMSLMLLGARQSKFGYGLIISPIDGKENCFRRSGYFTTKSLGVYKGVPGNLSLLKDVMTRQRIALL